MNKRNKVKSLNRDSQHRKAMIGNMVTSLFKHERIESTLAKIKVVRSHAEKLITRAKKNLAQDLKPEMSLHNKKEVMKKIHDRDVVTKLFNDIALRFKDTNGGYTRILKLVNRASDNSEVGILELVSRKTQDVLKAERKEALVQLDKLRKEKKIQNKKKNIERKNAPKKTVEAASKGTKTPKSKPAKSSK